MKTRVISAVVAFVLLTAVVYLGSVAIGIAFFTLSIVGMIEFYNALSKGGYKPVYFAGIIACLPLLYLALSELLGNTARVFGNTGVGGAKDLLCAVAIMLFVILTLLFCLLIFSNGRYTVADISVTMFGIVYIVFLFSFVSLTSKLENGYLYIWLIFIGAWATDTFAYFTGVTIGKTKILPKVSPKKSLEGSIGGIVGCIGVMLLFGAYFNSVLKVGLIHFALMGAICGVLSQIGDWSASAVKRAVNIKDYGNIMPGHGGVLDRLDSILFVAPAVYFYITLFF